jgi:hypothetical protein
LFQASKLKVIAYFEQPKYIPSNGFCDENSFFFNDLPPAPSLPPAGAGAHCDRTILFSYGVAKPSEYLSQCGGCDCGGAERKRSPRERLSDDFCKGDLLSWWLQFSNRQIKNF